MKKNLTRGWKRLLVIGYWLLVAAVAARADNVSIIDHQLRTTKPLPVHETGAVGAAGEAHLGQVGGNSDIITPTITVSTSPAYTANDVVGGKLTLTNAMRISGGTGILQSLCIIDKSNQKVALEILIFDSDPAAGTYTDNGAFSFNATDGAKLIRRISVAASDYATFGTAAVADISPGGKVLKASGSRNLYAVIVTTGTPTYAATGDLIIRFGILQD